jgi:hypothetical protein
MVNRYGYSMVMTTIQPQTHVRNVKSGKVAFVWRVNVIRHDGVRLVQVRTGVGQFRYWPESNVVPQ